MAVLKYRSTDGAIKTLGVNYGAGSVNAGVSSVNGKTGAVTGVYDVDNQPPYPVTSVNGKTGAITISEIKVAIVTTEVYGEGSRHRFLKSSLPGLNSSLTAPEAILSVVNASSVPMVSSRFEYDGNYVAISLYLLGSSPVTNSQTLTIFYR